MQKLLCGLAVILIILILACADEPEHYPETAVWTENPNGDSELALLMRAMYDDGIRTKHQILKGRKPDVLVEFAKIHSADATEPEKAASAEYLAYAKTYEAAVQALMEANRETSVQRYQSMVTACMSCHQAMCPGPVSRISKMYFSDKQLEQL